MNKTTVKIVLTVFGYLAVLYPAWVRIASLNWQINSALISNLFPLFGLLAFTFLWLHVVGAALEPWLNRFINFEGFINKTTNFILVFIILHPFLLFLTFDFSLANIFITYQALYIKLGIAGWLLLITYDVSKWLKRRDFFARNWNKILLISTIGFLFTFFHSLGLGSDLQSGALRTMWFFYGITGIVSTIYTYGIRGLLKRR